MDTILKPLKEDLKSLYYFDKIESAKLLNDKLQMKFIAENHKPMYFTGKFDAKTVFVMLNPGRLSDEKYSFVKEEKKMFATFDHFFENHVKEHINYGVVDFARMDNFDLKQAAFLFDFKDSGMNIPDFFNESNRDKILKLKAKELVLMNKLQLELIPYNSVQFTGVLDNTNLASKNIDLFIPHINRILDSIISFERRYVIFGARQFAYLFNAYKSKFPGKVKFGDIKCEKIEGIKHRVYWQTISIEHKDKVINAIIAYSFPRRDLPNAHKKMRKYGELCYVEFIKQNKII